MDTYKSRIPYTMYLVFLKKLDLANFTFEQLSSVEPYIVVRNKKDIYLELHKLAKLKLRFCYGFIWETKGIVFNIRKWIKRKILDKLKEDFRFFRMIYLGVYFKVKATQIERSQK